MKAMHFSIVILLMLSACAPDRMSPDAYGNFEATEVVVSSESAGRLLEWDVNQGMMLETNDFIGRVDTTSIHLRLAHLKAQMLVLDTKTNSVEAQINIIREQLSVAQREYDRIVSMYENGAATQKQLDDIDGQLRVLRRHLESTQTQKTNIQAEAGVFTAQYNLIQDELRKTIILSPIKGTVLATYVEQGELVTPGKPLLRLANLETMTLRAFLDAGQYSNIMIGQKVTVKVDHQVGSENQFRSYEGIVTWISPRAEFTPRTIQTREDRVNLVYAIKVDVINDGHLKIGMPGELTLEM